MPEPHENKPRRRLFVGRACLAERPRHFGPDRHFDIALARDASRQREQERVEQLRAERREGTGAA